MTEKENEEEEEEEEEGKEMGMADEKWRGHKSDREGGNNDSVMEISTSTERMKV